MVQQAEQPCVQFTGQHRWPDRLRLPLGFDPMLLGHDLAQLDGRSWTAHHVAQHYDGDWHVLPLRAPTGATHPILQIAPQPGRHDWADTELLAQSRYLRDILGSFACPLESVRLMRLAPGSTIKPHRDVDLAAEAGVARLHIPVITNRDVDFRLNGTRVDMRPGSVWYLRLADPHGVINAGKTPRVHLVIDAIVNTWLADLLNRAAALV